MYTRHFSATILISTLFLGGAIYSHGSSTVTDFYHPRVDYEVYGDGIMLPEPRYQRDVNFNDAAFSFVRSKLGLQDDEFVYQSGFSSDIMDHAYFKQIYKNITFTNAVANVALKDGKIVAFGSSFVPINKSNISLSTPAVSRSSAISIAEHKLFGEYNNHPTTMEYFAKLDQSIALVHVIQIRNESAGTWYQAHVDAHSGELVSVTNFVAQDSYLAVNIRKQSILDGESTQINPQNAITSPLGWHLPQASHINVTVGNNVKAGLNRAQNPVPASSDGNNFSYLYRTTAEPTSGQNPSAAAVNAFYVFNVIHDVAYLYGFTEAAFNFQETNFGRGGKGSDSVRISVQDSRALNNAFFATPPDGQPGECTMLLFEAFPFQIKRDSDMDNSILVHEATHGITNRLTGGGAANCLNGRIPRGLGEGWSDMMANWFEQTSAKTHDFILGTYSTDRSRGIRSFPYSTDPSINPLRYSSLRVLFEEHDIGEVWGNMLHNVYAALVENYGFSDTAMTDASPLKGNVIFMHLFIDSLALQPCEPTFIKARDAFIQAEQNRYAGTSRCLLWRAFASRGLGVNAADPDRLGDYRDGNDVPEECKEAN